MAASFVPPSAAALSLFDYRPPKTRSHRICHCVPCLGPSKRICRRNLLISCNNVQSEFISNAQPAGREFVPGFELAQENRLPTTGKGTPLRDDGFCNRRSALGCLLFTSVLLLSDNKAEADVTDEKPPWSLNLESYTDRNEGFTLLKPVQWSKVDKAGATVLFEDPESKGNTLGVVVNPVRISSLSEFGTPDAVAGKLLQAEKKKPSTNNVELINVKERQVHGAVPLYQLEYKLDSTRGAKRIFSAVTVASKKLYILNIAFVDSPQKPLSPKVASLLDHIVDSFDLLN